MTPFCGEWCRRWVSPVVTLWDGSQGLLLLYSCTRLAAQLVPLFHTLAKWTHALYTHSHIHECTWLQVEPPFKPDIKDDTDVSYFDTDFTSENPELTPPDNGEQRDIRVFCHQLPFSFPSTNHSLPPHLNSCLVSPPCSMDTIFSPSSVPGDPKAHVGDGVHFHDFTFAPEAGVNFQ